MSTPKIGIILSTTREGRFADKAAAWLLELVSARRDLEFEIVDLRDYPLPFYDEPISPLWSPPKNEVAQRWAKKIDSLDGFIFVTAEYNHSIPGVLKNAIDYVAHVFAKKPAAYVGYGGVGAARAIEQLRLINIEQQMAPLKSAVHIGGADFVDVLKNGKSLADKAHLVPSVNAMVEELGWWTHALKHGLSNSAPARRLRTSKPISSHENSANRFLRARLPTVGSHRTYSSSVPPFTLRERINAFVTQPRAHAHG